MVKIIQKDNPILREKAEDIKLSEIKSDKTKKVIDEMKEALDSQEDGVAIAAPQIAVSLRIFVVSGKVPKLAKLQKRKIIADKDYKSITKDSPDEVFINPKIVKISKEKEMMEEGCLSVRWFYGKVKRAKRVTIEAYDEKGKFVKKGAGGLLAQIFQHETEHLDGILFTDKAVEIKEIEPGDSVAQSASLK